MPIMGKNGTLTGIKKRTILKISDYLLNRIKL